MKSADLLDRWENWFSAEPARADRALLVEARAVFEREVADSVSDVLARVGARLYFHLGELPCTVELLRRYLHQELPPEDEFWGRWELVDHLAMLRRCAEAVAARDVRRHTSPVLA